MDARCMLGEVVRVSVRVSVRVIMGVGVRLDSVSVAVLCKLLHRQRLSVAVL